MSFRVDVCTKRALGSRDSDEKVNGRITEGQPHDTSRTRSSMSLLEYATELQNGRLVGSTREQTRRAFDDISGTTQRQRLRSNSEV